MSQSASEAYVAASHASMKSYVIGFGLSLLLTGLSFGTVMSGLVRDDLVLPAITVLAVAQLVVQLVFFLHLGTAPEQRNNTTIFVLTIMLIAIIVSGSLWVIHNANNNMMPTTITIDRAKARD
ncbi:cytochrome o ubiquinol oxidase subunit IV [Rhizobium altiplani]|uniref:Cytochrome bo(3) ubiquinol oxidase subunit 4 n=1 Tax=Rhizobium altiplani TaxID=1864509 RepID=A0A120FQF8_9HYPH|nr:cytochrome o ubiquinol oxidase subunit IV [Rhizobium altiplani]KWV58476.1 cytochrome o ubiquinol oxidase subunit IV [Rhizobium altiplani]